MLKFWFCKKFVFLFLTDLLYIILKKPFFLTATMLLINV